MLASVGLGDFSEFSWLKARKRRGESDTWTEERKEWHGRESDVGMEGEQRGRIWKGAALKHRSAGWIPGRCPFCQLLPSALVRRERIHQKLLFFFFFLFLLLAHFSLGLERWAICYKCMMNFIKYSQLLLKSLEICKIEPNMPRTDLTHRAEMWNLPEIKSGAGKFRSFMILLHFFFSGAEHDFIEIMTVTCFINVLFRQAS